MGALSAFWNHPYVQRTLYFFPFRLVLLHFKKNHVLLLFWVALTAFATGNLGTSYGVPHLFLDPEYMGRVDFWSFMLLGFALGGFIMAFHITSYTMNAHRFPFLATVSNPFFKYSLNNSLIPTAFTAIYIWSMVKFQYRNELFMEESRTAVGGTLLWDIGGLLAGVLAFMVPGYAYFVALSRDIFRVFGISTEEEEKPHTRIGIRKILTRNLKWREMRWKRDSDRKWKVVTYMPSPISVALARNTDHYDPEMLRTVIRQNHAVAAVFEVMVIFSFLMVGAYRETPELTIPAAAVLLLTLTMVLMLVSAVHAVMRGWTALAFVLIVALVHVLVQRNVLHYESRAFGMDYNAAPSYYHLDTLKKYDQDFVIHDEDVSNLNAILGNWKTEAMAMTKSRKPKLVIITVTGGGSRSAMWAMRAVQVADSLAGGRLMRQTHLITGASGGMLGMAYLREVYLRAQSDTSFHVHDGKYVDKMAADLLNPITVSLAVNDWFVRFQKFRDGKYVYSKDRGYALERQLILNSDSIFDKRLGDYARPEREGRIPMMVFAPNIINDGRSLFIASQPVSHLTFNHPSRIKGQSLQSGVEFRRFFAQHNPDNVWFTSVLRMNASFPYICPAVTLPSQPAMEVMDAGLRDSYGTTIAIKHLWAIRDWVARNTSGVILVQIRDMGKLEPITESRPRTLVNMLTNPLGNIYGNLFAMQDFNNDDLILYAQKWLKADLDVVDLELLRTTDEHISMSWHLTSREKDLVRRSAYHPKNAEAMQRIVELLNLR